MSHEEFWRLEDQIIEAADFVPLTDEEDVRWLEFARSQARRIVERDELDRFYGERIDRAASSDDIVRLLDHAPDLPR